MRILVAAVILVAALPYHAQAIDIAVTPSVLDLVSTTAVVDGFSLRGASQGDEFTLGFTVENRDADELRYLFTSIIYDPNVLVFLGGAADSILLEIVGGFIPIALSPLRAPEPSVVSPEDTLLGLTHVAPPGSPSGTSETGPDLAFTVTFGILDATTPTMILQAFLPTDTANVNDTIYCGVGAGSGICDIESAAIFDFQNFAIIPEPSTALLMGLGLVGLGVRRRD